MRLAGILALFLTAGAAQPSLAQEQPLTDDQAFEEWLKPQVGPTDSWIAVARGTVDVEGGLMRLAARREGLIVEVMAEAGDHVTKGMALARLDDSSARVQLGLAQGEVTQAGLQAELAQMRLDNARADLARLAPVARLGALPRKQIDDARRAVASTEVELRVAQQGMDLAKRRIAVQEQEIENAIVRAPVDGVILRRSARPGDATSSSTVTEMFLLAPDGKRVLNAHMDEQFVGQVVAGQKAQLAFERDPNSQLNGTVLRVAPVFGSATASSGSQNNDAARTVEVIISLDGPEAAISKLVLGQRMIARILK